jgi:hypothetical protein
MHCGSGHLPQTLGLVINAVRFSICVALLSGCGSAAAPIEVHSACSTFVSQSAPRHTPEIRSGKSGLELVLSLTPSHDSEAIAISEGARHGAELVIFPSREHVHSLGVEGGGYLVLSVASEAHAAHLLKLLCFSAVP